MELQTIPSERTLAVPSSALATLLESLFPPDDSDHPWGPIGPVVRRLRDLRLLLEPNPDPWRTPRQGPQPDPWRFVTVAGLAADRLVTLGQITITPDTQRAFQDRLSAFVDDFCGTPPRLRWPFPPRKDLVIDSISQVVVGVSFLRASAEIDDALCSSALANAGEKIAQVGLRQLGHEQHA
jgi:hypothetical protein